MIHLEENVPETIDGHKINWIEYCDGYHTYTMAGMMFEGFDYTVIIDLGEGRSIETSNVCAKDFDWFDTMSVIGNIKTTEDEIKAIIQKYKPDWR